MYDYWEIKELPNNLVYNTTMSIGGVFRVVGPFPYTIEINFYSLDANTWPNKILGNITIDGKFPEGNKELSWSSIYGDALKLVMFKTAYGFYATTYLYQISYNVKNIGEVDFS